MSAPRARPVPRWGPMLAALGAACLDAELPEFPPGRFACEGDARIEDGLAPCGEASWCVEGACTPRLGCKEPGRDILGCDPLLRRCEPVVTGSLAAVRCEGGVHTSTSARPLDPSACGCPDGLHCVAYLAGPDAGGAGFAPDLRFLPSGGPAPSVEIPERRLCVRACSEEDNCPADHTCRPAKVEGLPPADAARGTIAVCYPNVLPETSTSSAVVQPIARACRDASVCPSGDETCGYELDRVADHPAAPIGEVWAGRFGLVARCGVRGGVDAGRGCTNGQECQSGVCITGRCRAPCDPAAPERACGRRNCVSQVAARTVGGAPETTVFDRVHVCEQ